MRSLPRLCFLFAQGAGERRNLEPRYFPAAEWPAAGMVVAAAAARPGLRRLEQRHLEGGLGARARHCRYGDAVGDRRRAGHGRGGATVAADTAEVKAAYDADTREAMELGVFGAPT